MMTLDSHSDISRIYLSWNAATGHRGDQEGKSGSMKMLGRTMMAVRMMTLRNTQMPSAQQVRLIDRNHEHYDAFC